MLKIIKFYGDFCAPCRIVKPIFEEIKKEYSEKIEFVEINTDDSDNDKIVGFYSIVSIPTILFIKDDKIIDKISGITNKKQVVDMIKTYI